MPNLILSTVGTSLLGNQATGEERERLTEEANAGSEEISAEGNALIQNLSAKAREMLRTEGETQIRRASAELNGIYGFYEQRTPDREQDVHYLIATETAQGEAAAKVVAHYLRENGYTAQTYAPRCLTTKNKDDFSEGIKALLKWCDETLPGYRESGYDIIFNLTGGFKSLQGYMNTIGMFYADSITYIFESRHAELIEIPRLPVQTDLQLFEEHKDKFLLMAENRTFPAETLGGVPEALLDEIDGQVTPSVWGELLWNRAKQNVLARDLVVLPRLVYRSSFEKDWSRHAAKPKQRVNLQETLAKVSKLLEDEQGGTGALMRDNGLQYENYENERREGLPVGHFRVDGGRRVSCLAKEGELTLLHYGPHDYVNP